MQTDLQTDRQRVGQNYDAQLNKNHEIISGDKSDFDKKNFICQRKGRYCTNAYIFG